jgi:uncharacterized protein YjeT (DUF2065 family)
MRVALCIVSILCIVERTFSIIYTEGASKFLEKLVFRMNMKMLAILPLIFGLILMVGAFYCREMFWLAFILGLLAVIKGVYLLVAPLKQIKGLFEWWFHKASEETIRLMGLIAIILGSAILSYLV